MKKCFLILLACIVSYAGLTACINTAVAKENTVANTELQETNSTDVLIQEPGNTDTTSQKTTNSTAVEQRSEDTDKMQEVIRGSFAVQHIKTGKNLRPNPKVSNVEEFVANGNRIVLYPHAEWKCMTWQFTHVENNVYQLQNLYTKKTFQPSSNPESGVSIWQQPLKEDSLQYWEFIEQPDKSYLIKLKGTDLYLTISSEETNSSVILMRNQNSDDQRWNLIEQYPSF